MMKDIRPQRRIPRGFIKGFFGIRHLGYLHLYPSLRVEWCRVNFPWKSVEPNGIRMIFQRFDEMVEEWTVGDDWRLQAHIPMKDQPIIHVKLREA